MGNTLTQSKNTTMKVLAIFLIVIMGLNATALAIQKGKGKQHQLGSLDGEEDWDKEDWDKEDHHDDEKEEKDWAATEENCFAAGEFCGETKDEKACAWACTKCGKHFGAFEKEHGLKAGTIKKSCAAGKAKQEAQKRRKERQEAQKRWKERQEAQKRWKERQEAQKRQEGQKRQERQENP